MVQDCGACKEKVEWVGFEQYTSLSIASAPLDNMESSQGAEVRGSNPTEAAQGFL
jgi:hypothetical protein